MTSPLAPAHDRLPPTSTSPSSAAHERVASLFAAHSAQVLAFARRRCPELADDVLSETFLVAVRRAEEIPAGRELPWLYVVAEHVLLNLQRSQRRTVRTTHALRPFTRATAEPSEPSTIGAALGELPDRERILLTMTAFEGLSASEAAERMGIAHGSARNGLVRGRRNLRAAMVAMSAAAACLIAALVLVSGLGRREPATKVASRAVARTIAQAAYVHDVAVVRHGDAAEPGRRYERWTDPSADRTRVELPDGGQVVAARGQSLADAPRTDRASATEREDLAALDAASPRAIRALMASATSAHALTTGPTVRGQRTTLVRGRTTGTDGEARRVEAVIAEDRPVVLRVRTTPLVSGRAAVGAAPHTVTVDFTTWEAVDEREQGGSDPVAATSPPAATPAPAAGADADRAGAAHASAERQTAARSSAAAKAAGVRVGHGPAADATRPILHTRGAWTTCSYDGEATPDCRNYDVETWEERGGAQRRRTDVRKVGGRTVTSQGWLVGTHAHDWLRRRNGHVVVSDNVDTTLDGTKRPRVTTLSNTAWGSVGLPGDLAALITAHASDDGLPTETGVGGDPALVFRTSGPITLHRQRTITVEYDPESRRPVAATVRDEPASPPGPGSWGSSATIRIRTLETIPAGNHAGLLVGHVPARRDR